MSRVRDLADFNSRVMDMDGDATDTITADTVTADTVTADTVTLTASGTPTITSPTSIIINADSGNGIINFSGSKVMNLGDPVNAQDAAPKSYVDSSNYKDSDVDTYLNTSSAASGEVLSWNGTNFTWTNPTNAVVGTVGNFTLASSVIDTDDSSGITITPAVTLSSDLNVENDLTVRNTAYANNVSVDEDIKLTNGTGSIKTIRPAGTDTDAYGNEYNLPEHIWYEQRVYNRSMSGVLFAAAEMGGFPGLDHSPVTLYRNTPMLMSAEITIHIVTYFENYFAASYGTEFEDSQIIQGHLMHDYTTATFTETSNTCSNTGSNLITLSTEIDSDYVYLKMFPTAAKFTTVTINSRSAMTKIPGSD